MAPINYEVVISGIAGIFPGSDNVEEFEKNLMCKENLIGDTSGKWETGLLDVPNYLGKFKNNLTFDNKHFGIPNSLYQIMDPLTTQCVKYSFEAICDAGVNPTSLTGTNTAVIMSSSISETEYEVLQNCNFRGSYMVGQSRNMQANRISYFLNFKGPSLVLNSSWSGGMQALQEAYQLVSSGQATAALAGAGNIIFGPEISFHFQSMGRLNKDGKTKSFSADADGYTRSEGCVVFFLQRAEDAKRSYGTIINVLTSNYGARSVSFPDFSPDQYKDLLLRTYKEAHIDPSEVCYIEADGTGIKKMDSLELNAISEVMCKNRTTPLAIGSVKSNVGHSEVASTFMSIIKVLFAFKTGYIPPNLHYFAPNPDVPGLLSGQMKVITERTPLEGNIVGISGVGVSGSYSHAIIKSPGKKHLRQLSANNVPWLFVISGRVEPELVKAIEKVEAMPFKEEFIALTHNVFKSHIKGHSYRGYAILNEGDNKFHETKLYDVAEKRAIWFLFSGMGSQWPGMGADLMRLPTFERAINLCHEILLPKGINLLKIINSKDSLIYDNVLHSFIGIAAIQMGLVDVLREIGIEPDGIIGHSVGELGCAYADGCFTAKEMILSAFSRGKASMETKLVKGMMAAVGLGYNQIKDQLPPSIEVACHNSDTSCTLSGPVDDMNEYVAGLKEKGIFAKLVNVSNIAYHSRYIKPAAPGLLKYLQEVIQKPRERTKRWISSSIPESSWDSDLAKFSSAEYHTNNLLNSVLFEEASAHIPENAIVIEIAPHGLLQSIVKKALPNCTNIQLVNRFEVDTTLHLIKAIGKLYLEGISIKIDNFYPKVEFPVSSNVPYIAPMLTWDGAESFQSIEEAYKKKPCWEYYKLSEKRLEKYLGYKLFGTEVMPSVSLLMPALDIFARSKEFSKNGNLLLIENIQFKQSLETAKYKNAEIFFHLQKGFGDFEVNFKSNILASGRINSLETNTVFELEENTITKPTVVLNQVEIYKYFNEFSVEFGDNFKLIQNISFCDPDINATVRWKGQWVEFLDALLMVISLFNSLKYNELKIVHYIRQLYINKTYFESFNIKDIKVFYNINSKILSCKGLTLHSPILKHCTITHSAANLIKEICQFLPYYNSSAEKYQGQFVDCFQIVFHNIEWFKCIKKRLIVILIKEDEDFKRILSAYSSNNNIDIDFITSPTEDSVDELHLNLKSWNHLLIIGELHPYESILNCLKKVKTGFILQKENKNKNGKLNDFVPIFQFKYKEHFYTLFKMIYEEKFDLNIITVNTSNNWKANLKLYLKNNVSKTKSSSVQYVVGKIKTLSTVYNIVQFCKKLGTSEMIRFIFTDDESPSFSLDFPFYQQQIALDLIMNICVRGRWGCLKLLSLPNKPLMYPVNTEQKLIFPLSLIKGEDVKLTTLGINLSKTEENSQENQLVIFDYCGLDKLGREVCGIGTLSHSMKLIDDKLLCWQKPQHWTNEEAVSVPLCYLIAYSICERMYEHAPKSTILVHRATLLVSQAIIYVALSKGSEVFVTYTTLEEKNIILQIFPQINMNNIFPRKNGMFVSLLLNKIKRGVDVVINSDEDRLMVHSSLLCIARRGIFFQMNNRTINEDCTIGMKVYLKEIMVIGVSAESLLDLPFSVKKDLHRRVQLGIKEGHVKSLRTNNLPYNAFSVDAVERAKNENSAKIVFSMFCNKPESIEKDLFICSERTSYIIISNEYKFWLDLVGWLLNRGALNVHVLRDLENITQRNKQRIMSILNKFPSAKISLHPIANPANFSEMKKYLVTINCIAEISEIFILGKVNDEEVNKTESILRQLNRKANLICIGNGGESVCELRNKDKIPSLAISCDQQLMKAHVLLPELDHLIKISNHNSVIFLKEDIININKESNGYNSYFYQRLPANIKELLEFSRKSVPKACFVEIMTSSLPNKYNRELSPIFVIPSLRPNELSNLTARLHYPTFEARLPNNFDDIDKIAKQLFEDTKRFKFNIFTIIANDWGGVLGLNLAKYLENDGKLVLLILLNGSPDCVRNWVGSALQMGEDNIIYKYVKAPYKVQNELLKENNWQQKVCIALQNYSKEETEREELKNALNFLRNSLLCIMKKKFSDKTFDGKCFIYLPSGLEGSCNIAKNCKRKPVINVKDASNHQEMLDDQEIVNEISSLIPYEYKTAAQDLDCETFGQYEHKSLRNWLFDEVMVVWKKNT